MNNSVLIIVGIVAVALFSFLGAQFLARRIVSEQKKQADEQLQQASETARSIEIEARDNAVKIKQEAENVMKANLSQIKEIYERNS